MLTFHFTPVDTCIQDLVEAGDDAAVNLAIDDLILTGIFPWLERHARVLELDSQDRPCRWKILDSVLECDHSVAFRSWKIDGTVLRNTTHIHLQEWLRNRVIDLGVVVDFGTEEL